MRITTDATAIAGLLGTFSTPSTSFGSAAAAPTLFGPDVLLGTSQARNGGAYSPIPQPQFSPAEQKRQKQLLKQVDALRAERDFAGAQKLIDGLLKDHPTHAPAIHAAGVLQLEQGNNAAAQKLFEKAHVFAPQYGFNTDAENARILQGDRKQVEETARRMLRNPAQRDQGQRLLVAQTKQHPSHTAARVLLAETLLQNGDATNALLQYQTAISTANETELHGLNARFKTLVRQAPTAAFVRGLYGQTQLRLGQHEEALKTLQKASELGGHTLTYQRDVARAHVAVGRDLLDDGNERAALRHFEQALDLNKSSATVRRAYAEGLTARAEKLVSLGDPAQAMLKLEQARGYLGGTEADDELRQDMAAIAFDSGRRLQMRREASGEPIGDEVVAFQLAHELDPDQVVYRHRLSDVREALGDEAMAAGDLEAATEAYRAAYELVDNDDELNEKAILAFEAWGDERAAHWGHDDAIEAYQFAWDLSGDDAHKLKLAETYVSRAQMYITLEDESQARQDLEAALELYPDNEAWQALLDGL